MNLKFIGGILLIVGTSIGGGMLALPVATASVGFWPSSLFLLLCWAIMTLGALFILEANLYLPAGKHMVSMASATLGKGGLIIAWLSYLFLLYTLLSAYISGGADVMSDVVAKAGISLSNSQSSLLFTLIFGSVVYGGIHKVDLLNRALMFGKLAIYVMLVILISPFVQRVNLNQGDFHYVTASIMILITSFGFAIIVPNLRDYFNDDLASLRKVILIGSLIPLICYLAWNMVITGSYPSSPNGLAALMHSDHATSELSNTVSNVVQSTFISSLFNFFTSICMLTAFLGVALCLISFLADGFKVQQQGKTGLMLFVLTFLPPLLIVTYYPGAYIHALNYAGIFCIILLLLLPALMVVYGRKKFSFSYQVPGGMFTPWLVIMISALLLLHALMQLS